MKRIALFFLLIAVITGVTLGQAGDYYSSHSTTAGSTTAQEVTYADLVGLQTTTALMPNKEYELIDFQTIHTIFGTATTNTGPVEMIVVKAASPYSLYEDARSITFPTDQIKYRLIPANVATPGDYPKGQIVYRHANDAVYKNVTAYTDFRVCKQRRWETSVGSGVFSEWTDPGNGEANQDFKMFNESAVNENVFIGRDSSGYHPNIVFLDSIYKVRMGDAQDQHSYIGQVNDLNLAGCNSIIVRGDTSNLSCYSNCVAVFNNSVNNVVLGPGFGSSQTITFTGYMSNDYLFTDTGLTSLVTATGDHINESLGGGLPWSLTSTNITSLISVSALVPGQLYKLTDTEQMVRSISTTSYRVEW